MNKEIINKQSINEKVCYVPDCESESIKEFINRLANSDCTTQIDEQKLLKILNILGFNAVITCGIVYLNGVGTINNQPQSIKTTAQMILNTIRGIK